MTQKNTSTEPPAPKPRADLQPPARDLTNTPVGHGIEKQGAGGEVDEVVGNDGGG